MKRTQLQLDDRTYQLLRRKAFEQGVSMAAVVRDALAQFLSAAPMGRRTLEDFDFVASGRSAKSPYDPISERHDEALAEDFDT
ncbi:MAG: hypothetical protein IH956_05825 [Chloroflexi bacterium]|nr:hypothetical protein [Chloroflexota bacterium]